MDSGIYNYLKVTSKDENDSIIWEYKASNYEIDKYVYMSTYTNKEYEQHYINKNIRN